jgi:hypothetical protein
MHDNTVYNAIQVPSECFFSGYPPCYAVQAACGGDAICASNGHNDVERVETPIKMRSIETIDKHATRTRHRMNQLEFSRP